MLEITKQNIINLTVLNEDVDILQSIFDKLTALTSKPGYKKDFTKEETKLINDINTELNG